MKKISKKNLRLNKEVVASLSENEMQKVVGGDVTGKDTANESICICALSKVPKDCPSYAHVCAESRDYCMVSENCKTLDCSPYLSEKNTDCCYKTQDCLSERDTNCCYVTG